jgi:hypothetical protein
MRVDAVDKLCSDACSLLEDVLLTDGSGRRGFNIYLLRRLDAVYWLPVFEAEF